MPRPTPPGSLAARGRRLKFSAVLGVAALLGVATASLAGLAAAKSPATLLVAHNVKVAGKVENIAVNSKAVTVYTLSGETARHQTCTKASDCFVFWFPVTVASKRTKLTAATGIKGKLGTISRNGFVQVTLAGHPLYTFKLDNAKRGQALGQGIPSFGGVWHVVAAAANKRAPTHTTTTTTTTSTTTGPFGY
jgi:predicted lipoprotein with Yx(FWY)xxD motif